MSTSDRRCASPALYLPADTGQVQLALFAQRPQLEAR